MFVQVKTQAHMLFYRHDVDETTVFRNRYKHMAAINGSKTFELAICSVMYEIDDNFVLYIHVFVSRMTVYLVY